MASGADIRAGRAYVELFLKDQRLRTGLRAAGNLVSAFGRSAIVGVGAAAGAGTFLAKLAADAETTATSFRVLIGDVKESNQVLAGLKKFGAETPFEFPELADASKKLLAFGVSTDDLLPTLRRLGDVSAGLGIPIAELSEIYGKARVQGRLFAEDVNQLTGRGIPIIQEFAKQFGVADSEVKKLVETGKVGFPELEKAFIALTSEGGKFSGMMEAQSQTVSGLFSTLKDNVTQAATEFGTLATEGMDLKGIFEELIALVERFNAAMNDQATKNTFFMLGEIARQNVRNMEAAANAASSQKMGDANSRDAQFWRDSMGDTPMRGSANPWEWSRGLKQGDISLMSPAARAEAMGTSLENVLEADRLAKEEQARADKAIADQKAREERLRRFQTPLALSKMGTLDDVLSSNPFFSTGRQDGKKFFDIVAPKNQDWDSVRRNRESPVKGFELPDEGGLFADERKAASENRKAPVKGFDLPDENGLFADERRQLFDRAMSHQESGAKSTGAFFSAMEAVLGGQAASSPQKESAKSLTEIKGLMKRLVDTDAKNNAIFEKLFNEATS